VTEKLTKKTDSPFGEPAASSTPDQGTLITMLEKASGKRVMLCHSKWPQEALNAAFLAAEIVIQNQSPSGEWVNGQFKNSSDTLVELCGIRDWKPFAPDPCPLSPTQRDAAIGFLRTRFRDDDSPDGKEYAVAFVQWAIKASAPA
jgi:hypothetical protein